MPDVTLEQALQIAIQHHQSGRLPDAESVYRQILSIQPNYPDAAHLLGVLMYQHGRHGDAESLIRRAIALNPAAEYFSNLAAVLEAQGRADEALAAHRHALGINPNSPAAHNNYGSLLQKNKQAGEAEDQFRRAVALWPDFADAHFNLANVLRETGRYEAALAEYHIALGLRPDYAEAQLNLGLTLWKLNRLDEALKAFLKAAGLRASFPEAHLHLALLFEQMGRTADTIRACHQALLQRPEYPEALLTLGHALKTEGKLDEAVAAYRESLQLRPDSAEVLSSLAGAVQEQGDLQDAIALSRRALELRPDLAEAHVNLATALRENGQFDDANREFSRALELRPGYPEARWNFGLGCLLQGKLLEGWELYESRLNIRGLIRPRDFPQPLWDGSPLNGRRILLHAEQGFGDTIQFVRYVPRVASRGGSVVLQCQSALKRLLTGQFKIDPVIDDSDPLPIFDVHCPLMSLPRVLGTTLETIPSEVPYLAAEPGRVEQWRQRLSTGPAGLKIGIVWAGRDTHKNDRNRSMRLADFAPLVERATSKGARIYSLQKGEPATQGREVSFGSQIIDPTGELNDFADTAALVSNLDLVIAVDTAVAHLAGAVGTKVWVLLPFSPDWRWMLERADSPWYPTMRLFRQSKPRDWRQPVERATEELLRLQ